MLDLKYVRSHLAEVKAALASRGQELLLADFEVLDEGRRRLLAQVEAHRHERNRLSEEVGRRKKAGEDASALMAQVREINQQLRDLEGELAAKEAAIQDYLLNIPNIPHSSVPLGASSEDNPVVKRWGEPPVFSSPPARIGKSVSNWGSWTLRLPPRSPAPVSPCCGDRRPAWNGP